MYAHVYIYIHVSIHLNVHINKYRSLHIHTTICQYTNIYIHRQISITAYIYIYETYIYVIYINIISIPAGKLWSITTKLNFWGKLLRYWTSGGTPRKKLLRHTKKQLLCRSSTSKDYSEICHDLRWMGITNKTLKFLFHPCWVVPGDFSPFSHAMVPIHQPKAEINQ